MVSRSKINIGLSRGCTLEQKLLMQRVHYDATNGVKSDLNSIPNICSSARDIIFFSQNKVYVENFLQDLWHLINSNIMDTDKRPL